MKNYIKILNDYIHFLKIKNYLDNLKYEDENFLPIITLESINEIYEEAFINFIKKLNEFPSFLNFKEEIKPSIKINCKDYIYNKFYSSCFDLMLKAEIQFYPDSNKVLILINSDFSYNNKILYKKIHEIKIGLKRSYPIVVSEEHFLFNYNKKESYINKDSILSMIEERFKGNFPDKQNIIEEVFSNHSKDQNIMFIRFLLSFEKNNTLLKSNLLEKYDLDILLHDINHGFPTSLFSIFD